MLTEQPIDLLEENENYLVRADAGLRLANFIIDIISFYSLAIILGIILGLVAPSVVENIPDDPGFNLIDRLISMAFYGLYMSIVEAVFKGKSLGKLITGTRAVNMDGSRISTSTAFARGFSRAVPFCAFSALGTPCNPWQDRWTETLVINVKRSAIHDTVA